MKLVSITFWDHSSGSTVEACPFKCEVIGVLYKEDKLCYYVASWICAGNIGDHNSEGYTVLKSTVISKKVLKEVK